ncbi:MAG: single-stranded DNA-binding protein [Opitutales bacterium]
MNTVHLSGNLTADVEHRSPGGQDLCVFTLAVNNRSGNDDRDHTLFLKVQAWNQPHLREYLGKGSKVLVTGSLKPEHWETREGEKRSAISCTAYQVEFLNVKPPQGAERSDDAPARRKDAGRQQAPHRRRQQSGAVREPAAAYPAQS